MTIETSPAPSPIIVFGAPRSGTTYLQQLLDAHPEVYISHETRVFAWLHEAVSRLPENEYYVLRGRDRFVARLKATLPGLIRDFYAELAPDARYWGDKNPHYADQRHRGLLALTAELFPESRFVNIVRDGRDVVSSLVRMQHSDGTPWVTFEGAHQTWISHVDIGCTFGARHPDRYFEVRYEALVRDDLGVARQLFDFLDIGFDPSVADFCRDQGEERTPFSEPTRDLADGVTGSEWSDVFAPDEQLASLARLGPQLVQLGYETRESLNTIRERIAPSPEAPVSAPVIEPVG